MTLQMFNKGLSFVKKISLNSLLSHFLWECLRSPPCPQHSQGLLKNDWLSQWIKRLASKGDHCFSVSGPRCTASHHQEHPGSKGRRPPNDTFLNTSLRLTLSFFFILISILLLCVYVEVNSWEDGRCPQVVLELPARWDDQALPCASSHSFHNNTPSFCVCFSSHNITKWGRFWFTQLFLWKKTILICQKMDESRQPVESGGGVWQVAGRTSTRTSLFQFFQWFFAFIFHVVVFMGDLDELGLLVMVFVLSGQYLTYYGQNKCPSLVPHHY